MKKIIKIIKVVFGVKMITVGIITEERDWITSDLENHLIKHGANVKYLKPSKLIAFSGMDIKIKHGNDHISNLDCAFVRSLGNDFNIFRFDILRYLNNYVPLINPPNSLEIANNKLLTTMVLDNNKIPHPKTVITEDVDKGIIWTEKFKDCVIKPLWGNRGKGIIRIKEKPLMYKINILKEFKKKYGALYIQEFIPNPSGIYRDIRSFVIGDEVVSAMYRVSKSWKTNIHQNGKPEKCEITEEIIKLSLNAKKSVGLIYGAVDIIESSKGLLVLEVNGAPSWEGLSMVSDANIGNKLAEYIVNNYG